MSNLPSQSAVTHNDDNDEQSNSSASKFSTINSRITSPLIIKRQQNIETEIANNQAYDEIHDLQPKHSSTRKTNTDQPSQHCPSKANSSHDLMQGNYYDQTRYDVNCSPSSSQLSDPQLIHINVDEYKKTIAPVSTSKNNSIKTRSSSPPFGHTSESIQQGIAQSAGILLELNKKPHQSKTSMKNNHRSHERAVIDYYPPNETESSKPRSLSASSSSSNCSTSDSSTSNKCQNDNEKTNIPYQKLTNDEDDDELGEQTKKPATESSTLLNKNLSQSYGTQSTSERSKYLPNNGYNSHGSSITTKSSSDNSGSIRTNSGSDNDNDAESDEEHYNNSTASNHSQPTSSKSINKQSDARYLYSNEQSSYQSGRSNASRSEQIANNGEHHSQVPRLKQLPNDDPNGNNSLNKLSSGSTDHPTLPSTSKWPSQSSSANQTNTLPSSSSSHPNRNLLDRQEQQQQHHSNSSRNNARQHQIRTSKKRKQSQQQETIRTELIPGHRGDRDVDELVSFIDGNSSKQRQNSSTSHSTDTQKSKLNLFNDSNSNKSTSRKKSRKSVKALPPSATDDHENQTADDPTSNEPHTQPTSSIDEENSTTRSIVDITNQRSERHSSSPTINHTDETDPDHPLQTVHANTTKTNNGGTSLPDWFEQTRDISLTNDDEDDSYRSSSTLTNHSNSEPISEPFVTVTHRRRLTKERRQDNNPPPARSSRFPPAPPPSSNSNDKRRIPPISQNGIQRPTTQQHFSNQRATHPSATTEENNNNRNNNNNSLTLSETVSHPTLPTSVTLASNNEQILEKRQSSPRLSSHSSSSSLSSLIKRQSKPPPVVFLNKSIDIELNDVSFGFDLDSAPLDKPSDETNTEPPPSTSDLDTEPVHTPSPPASELLPTESVAEKHTRRPQQRYRGAQFYSGSDIRPHHHRPYPSQPMSAHSSYIDPLVLFQYNQQRLANYSQQLAYMNFFRGQYIPPQSQYVCLPTAYTATTAAAGAAAVAPTTSEIEGDEEANQPSSEQTVEPVVVFATPTGQLYYHSSAAKKPYIDSEQTQPAPVPAVYTTTPTVFPPHYFYPPQAQHFIASHPAYFQPIVSPSLPAESKSEQAEGDDVDPHDDDCDKSAKQHLQTRQQASSDIMSNALQLVYSQQRRNAQTDRFNLDDLTAYLAMKWTDTVDHYEQGDNRILLVGEQS